MVTVRARTLERASSSLFLLCSLSLLRFSLSIIHPILLSDTLISLGFLHFNSLLLLYRISCLLRPPKNNPPPRVFVASHLPSTGEESWPVSFLMFHSLKFMSYGGVSWSFEKLLRLRSRGGNAARIIIVIKDYFALLGSLFFCSIRGCSYTNKACIVLAHVFVVCLTCGPFELTREKRDQIQKPIGQVSSLHRIYSSLPWQHPLKVVLIFLLCQQVSRKQKTQRKRYTYPRKTRGCPRAFSGARAARATLPRGPPLSKVARPRDNNSSPPDTETHRQAERG